ncbi:hypothetical protein SUGI_0897930 [Cryptomeria japonica]|nr:hypothetical protein SUGI_0897930 [Cryptomeria japonica]
MLSSFTKVSSQRSHVTTIMLLDNSGSVKIAEFGVTRAEDENLRDMTYQTDILGYMAQEVLDGTPFNKKCDVFSFGFRV